jgi:uncharacterized protein YcbK (DUF882 family)
MTKNFSISEFQCKCGCEMPDDVKKNVEVLAENLQIVRDILDEPIRVNSAYRCVAHNKDIGGVSNSQHILGKASDVVISNLSPEKVYVALDRLMDGNFIAQGGLGKYNTFTHYDIRGHEARW